MFLRHALIEDPTFDVGQLPGPAEPFWERLRGGRGIMTDRSKVHDLLLDYFRVFLQPQYERDVLLAREQLCYGISIDETFKVAMKCRVRVEGGRYKAVSYCLHTVHSSCTQMAVACRFMRSKSAMDKAVCIRLILQAQTDAEQAGRPAQPTLFVATDNPVQDVSMLRAVHAEFFPEGHAVYGLLAVGDDVWHAYHRIGRELPGPAKAPGLHKRLKRVFHLIYRKAEEGDTAIDVWDGGVASAAELAKLLREWARHHKVGSTVRHAVRNCIRNAKYLFTFLPHAARLLRYGTTANEHGNWSLNRKFKFTSHMRPDHMLCSILWVFYLHSCLCAHAATGNFKLTDEQRALCSTLFVRPVGVPFERLAQQHKAPYIIPMVRHRVYTAADAIKDLGLLYGAPVEDAADGDLEGVEIMAMEETGNEGF